MSQDTLRKAAKDLCAKQRGLCVAQLREVCKHHAMFWSELRSFAKHREASQRSNIDALPRDAVRKVARELGVKQNGQRHQQLCEACKRSAVSQSQLREACQRAVAPQTRLTRYTRRRGES